MKSQIYTLDIPNIHRFAVGFDKVLDELTHPSRLNESNYPPYNIVKVTETLSTIEVAVAGFDENELDIEIVDNKLVIKGEHINPQSDVVYAHKGIASRNFSLSFALAENVKVRHASVRNGILAISLELMLPKMPDPIKIAISFCK